MKIHRIDHVGVVVHDLPATKSFFLDLGLEILGAWEVEGEWLVDRVIGLDNVKNAAVMLGVPGGQATSELIQFFTPADELIFTHIFPELLCGGTIGARVVDRCANGGSRMDVVDITLMDSWAEEEFAAAALGDARRTKRLIALADTFARRPAASLPHAAQDPAMLKAAYRFFDTDAIEPDAILASHCTATQDRCASVPLVLAVQDTSELDWSQHPATTGLGPIHTKTHVGLLMHTTLAITPEAVPLGILQQYVWARDPATFGVLPDQHTRAFEDKESYRWVRGLTAINAARDACPTTQFVLVADAEADIYDLMVAERRAGVDLLLRAGQDRRVEHPEATRLWKALPLGTRAGTRVVHIPARDGKPARTAEVTIWFQNVTIRPPKHRAKEKLASVTVAAVWAIEQQPPADMEALEWLLLSSRVIDTAKQAVTVLDWYCRRWGIELWHKGRENN